MSVRNAPVVPANPARAAQVIQTWREHYCGTGLDQILTSLFAPLTPRQRIAAMVDGSPVLFEPSWFALGSVVLVFHRPNAHSLHVAFFDQSTGQFFPAVASLTMTERGMLGGGRKRDRETFLAELIEAARPAGVPVGA